MIRRIQVRRPGISLALRLAATVTPASMSSESLASCHCNRDGMSRPRQKLGITHIHPEGNRDGKPEERPSRGTSHGQGLHVEGKSLFVTPDGDYMDSIFGCCPAGLLRVSAGPAARGNLKSESCARPASLSVIISLATFLAVFWQLEKATPKAFLTTANPVLFCEISWLSCVPVDGSSYALTASMYTAVFFVLLIFFPSKGRQTVQNNMAQHMH
jgi:hypothetical protein